MLPTRFRIIGKAVSEEKIFRNRPIRNKNCLWWPCLLMDRDEMSNFIVDCPQMLPTKFQIIWPSGCRGEEFLTSAIQKQESPVVAMFVNGSGRNEQSLQRTFHRYTLQSLGTFGQVVSEEKIFKNRPIRHKNYLWQPCLLSDRNEISNRNRGLSIDSSYQVSVHLAKQFHRGKI